MKIKLKTPEYFQEIGRKDNQEDNFVVESPDNRFFILCDGMGGHENGEVASSTVCGALSEYFIETPPEKYKISQEYFDRAVEYAYQKLDEKDDAPDPNKKMGTTMTCVYFGDNGVLVAHIGDSRVYQIRPTDYTKDNYKNAVKIETKDHSLVRQLIEIGQLSEEAAKTHPRRNFILKCMQPNEEEPDMPDYVSSDVKIGDYFFLCSDGILENITTEILCEVLAENTTDKEKITKLKSYCDGNTNDNYTCILLHVKSGKLEKIKLDSSNSDIEEIVSDDDDSVAEPHKTMVADLLQQKYSIILITGVVFLCLFLFFANLGSCLSGCNNETQTNKTFKEKIDTQFKNSYTRTPLGMDMYLFSKGHELVLVNEKTERVVNLTSPNGVIILNGEQVKVVDCQIPKFSRDAKSKDTVAKIELTLENGKKVELKINTNGEIINI
ncbi:MAG: serine/threonine-protein phosphatase [Bacteroidales bacterium]|nr:serine/threonine-protein phosphatase [Bacteroidales bacterium]